MAVGNKGSFLGNPLPTPPLTQHFALSNNNLRADVCKYRPGVHGNIKILKNPPKILQIILGILLMKI